MLLTCSRILDQFDTASLAWPERGHVVSVVGEVERIKTSRVDETVALETVDVLVG